MDFFLDFRASLRIASYQSPDDTSRRPTSGRYPDRLGPPFRPRCHFPLREFSLSNPTHKSRSQSQEVGLVAGTNEMLET